MSKKYIHHSISSTELAKLITTGKAEIKQHFKGDLGGIYLMNEKQAKREVFKVLFDLILEKVMEENHETV